MTAEKLLAALGGNKDPFRPFGIQLVSPRYQGVFLKPEDYKLAEDGSAIFVAEDDKWFPAGMVRAVFFDDYKTHVLEVYRITVDQYEKMVACGALDTDDRCELIEGLIMRKVY